MTIGSLQAQDFTQQLIDQYQAYREPSLKDRRFKHQHLQPLIDKLPDIGFKVEEAGKSYQGKSIYHISIGEGPISVLLWSQMHGNEATATMALFDIFNYLAKSESDQVRNILANLSIHFIPMLNPDGAEVFERRTSQGIDMNRDALRLTCPESYLLKSIRDSLDADWGFNLHDQNIYYNVGSTPTPATISFLAPAYNRSKDTNSKREDAMQLIVAMNEALQQMIPGGVGKYDDTFEPRAFGDNIQKWGTRTILIESGGYAGDPEKQFIRELNYVSILTALNAIAESSYDQKSVQDYWEIPFNESDLNDLLIRNVTVRPEQGAPYQVDIAIRRAELDDQGNQPVYYRGTIEDLGDLSTQYGYVEVDGTGLEYALGKTYPEKFDRQDSLEDSTVNELLAQGYTYLSFNTNYRPTISNYGLPFDSIKEDLKLPAVPTIEQSATFLLIKDGEVVHSVVNGFLYTPGEDIIRGNGWIFN